MQFICAFKRYTPRGSIDQIISRLKETVESLFNQFSNNQIKSKPDKCHLLLNNSCKKIKIREVEIKSSAQEKLLGITINNNLKFASHVGKNYMLQQEYFLT